MTYDQSHSAALLYPDGRQIGTTAELAAHHFPWWMGAQFSVWKRRMLNIRARKFHLSYSPDKWLLMQDE